MTTNINSNNVQVSQEPEKQDYKIPEDLVSEIKRRATDEALRGLKDLWKREIEKVYEDFDASSYRNFRDALRGLGDYMISKLRNETPQHLTQQVPQAGSQTQHPQQQMSNIDIEKLKAQIKAEYDEKLKQEKRALYSTMAYETLANYALSKGLNPKYKDIFAQIVKTKYLVDFDDEEKLVYRNPETKELILEKGLNPSLDYLIMPFLESHSELFSVPKQGAGIAGGAPLGTTQSESVLKHETQRVQNMDTVSMIDAVLKGG